VGKLTTPAHIEARKQITEDFGCLPQDFQWIALAQSSQVLADILEFFHRTMLEPKARYRIPL
jgi:hypothetical protein